MSAAESTRRDAVDVRWCDACQANTPHSRLVIDSGWLRRWTHSDSCERCQVRALFARRERLREMRKTWPTLDGRTVYGSG